MLTYGVISGGRIALDRGVTHFKAGSVVEWTPEQASFFLQRAPENFVFLAPDFVMRWSVALASRFMPGQDLFALVGEANRPALLEWQARQLAPQGKKKKKGQPDASTEL